MLTRKNSFSFKFYPPQPLQMQPTIVVVLQMEKMDREIQKKDKKTSEFEKNARLNWQILSTPSLDFAQKKRKKEMVLASSRLK